jgi:hypothetical protein
VKDVYICLAGKFLKPRQRWLSDRTTMIKKHGSCNFRGLKAECSVCSSKAQCCQKDSARRLSCSIHKITETDAREDSKRGRKKVEMLFAHPERLLKSAVSARTGRNLAELKPKLDPLAEEYGPRGEVITEISKAGWSPETRPDRQRLSLGSRNADFFH